MRRAWTWLVGTEPPTNPIPTRDRWLLAVVVVLLIVGSSL